MLAKLILQNFRNYSKRAFNFDAGVTLIVGPNAIGKTNILEAVYLLSTGKSFRGETEREVVKEGENFARVLGGSNEELAVFFDLRERFAKTYQVNGVGRRQVDFVGHLPAVLFSPTDIEIVADSPSTRRRYLDMVLGSVHREYRVALAIYEKALRQRNKLLERIRDGLVSDRSQLSYWNSLLINNGKILHETRRGYLDFLSNQPISLFPLNLTYDHSVISPERLEKYREEEVAAATTLVGPHRDNFLVFGPLGGGKKLRDVRVFGSRGEQRLAVFVLKLGELGYLRRKVAASPMLLLDDIFSELDHENRHRLLGVIPQQQTILTTTDLHLVEVKRLGGVKIIELKE